MLAAQESGCRSLAEFLDTDAKEYEAWSRYALAGPSNFRTQLLLVQLIQMVAGALGGKTLQVEKILPFYEDIIGSNTPRGRAEKRKRAVAHHQSIVDSLIAKKVNNNG